jgi:hypothetical protein
MPSFCNSEALEQMSRVVFKQVEQEQTKLYNSFLDVARADWAAALVMVPLFFVFAVQTIRMVAGDERQRCALFPESRFFAAVVQKRAGQIISLDQFTDAVLRRVISEVARVPAFSRAECAVLMWTEFLGGWMPTSSSGEYCEDARRQWMSIKQQGTSNDGGHGGRALKRAQDGGSVSPDEAAAELLLGRARAGQGAQEGLEPSHGRSSGGPSHAPWMLSGTLLGCLLHILAGAAFQGVGITAAPIAPSVGSRLVSRCQGFYQMARGIQVPGEVARS